MGPSADRVDSQESCSVTLCAVAASFRPRDVYSDDSRLGEVQPAKENEANRFLRVGKVNVNWIYQVIFQGCLAVRACKTILYLKILWEFVLKGRFSISARDWVRSWASRTLCFKGACDPNMLGYGFMGERMKVMLMYVSL